MPVWLIWVAVGLSVATAVFSAMMMRKAQKKNKGAEASQDVGSIAEEGATTSQTYGTVDMYPIYTEFFGLENEEVKQKSGGKK